MTCTHAALTRHNLIDLRFKYDNLIMEESAQILEVSERRARTRKVHELTVFLSLCLSVSGRDVHPHVAAAVRERWAGRPDLPSWTVNGMIIVSLCALHTGVSRLKRVVLIGDHHQLPPVVKNRVPNTAEESSTHTPTHCTLYPSVRAFIGPGVPAVRPPGPVSVLAVREAADAHSAARQTGTRQAGDRHTLQLEVWTHTPQTHHTHTDGCPPWSDGCVGMTLCVQVRGPAWRPSQSDRRARVPGQPHDHRTYIPTHRQSSPYVCSLWLTCVLVAFIRRRMVVCVTCTSLWMWVTSTGEVRAPRSPSSTKTWARPSTWWHSTCT